MNRVSRNWAKSLFGGPPAPGLTREGGGRLIGAVRRLAPAALAAVLLAASPDCVRILPKDRPEPPAAAIDRHVLCASVKTTEGWAEPGPDAAAFSRGPDAAVHSFLELRGVRGRHEAAWRWYGPSGLLIRASDPVGIGEDGRTYARYIAWDKLALHEGREPGFWTVAVLIDGRLASSRSFEIR